MRFSNAKPPLTPEQIARAKEVDILDYLQRNEPKNLRLVGREHRLRDHDSLTISNGLWHWHSRGIGGKNVIDYLVKVRDYDFVESVLHIVNETPAIHASYSTSAPRPPPKPFDLPPRHRDNERVIAYLHSRGIDKPLIRECIERGMSATQKEQGTQSNTSKCILITSAHLKTS
jgi:hypothetical protein